MSTDLDWAPLEGSVARAAARVQALTDENRTLRAEVARLEAELASARSGTAAPAGERAAEVRRRLERLESELEALLGAAASGRAKKPMV